MSAQQEAVRGETELNHELRSSLVMLKHCFTQKQEGAAVGGGPLTKITDKAEQERYQLDAKVLY